MPFNRLFQKEAIEGEAVDEEERRDIEVELGELLDEIDVYETPAWDTLEKMLLDEQKSAFADMMTAETEQQIILARERARVVSRLLRKPETLRERRHQLKAELLELEE